MLWRISTTIAFWLSLLFAAVFLVLTTLRGLDLPSQAFWTRNVALMAPLFVLGVIAAASLPIQLVLARRRLRESRTRQLLTNYSRLLFQGFMETRTRLALDLAVHVWRVDRRFLRHPRLSRLVTFRLSSRVPSMVTWTKGKGVLGQCWERREVIVADLRPLRATADQDEQAFLALGETDRFGLTWEEFQQVRSFTAIFASPLTNRKGEVIGCVSVDSTADKAYTHLRVTANTRSIQETVHLMASALEAGDEQ